MDPVAALEEIAFLLERDRASSFKSKAFRRAADVIGAYSTPTSSPPGCATVG